MSRLLQLRDAVVAAIQQELPAFDVAGHLGRFDAKALTTFITRAPAVRVAVLGLADIKRTGVEGEREATARLGVFIITRDGREKLSRDTAVCMAAERILLLTADNGWGLGFAYPAEPGAAQNLFSDETLNSGAALWALDVNQRVVLGAPEAEGPPSDEDPLTTLYVGLAPNIGADHEADYIGPFPQEQADG